MFCFRTRIFSDKSIKFMESHDGAQVRNKILYIFFFVCCEETFKNYIEF